MADIVDRRSLKKKEDLNRVLNLTRRYYGLYSDEYVQFYSNWLTGEGNFSDTEYKIGYDKVAQILAGLVRKGELVIDIGCGVGAWSILLAKNGACVVGLDYSSEALIRCRERGKEAHVDLNILGTLADGFYLPFKDEIFEGGTLNWVLAHIPLGENKRFMKEVKRVLRRDSWLMISDSYWRGQEGGKEQVQTRKTEKGISQVYKYYYTPEELQSLLEDSFGEVLRLETTPYEMLCVAKK
jgi:ubiquinone/menaquinone biosynthesis C-methylase UbiE